MHVELLRACGARLLGLYAAACLESMVDVTFYDVLSAVVCQRCSTFQKEFQAPHVWSK